MLDPAEVSPAWVSRFPLESVAESEEKSAWLYCLFYDEETMLVLRDPIVPVTGGVQGSSQSVCNRRGTRQLSECLQLEGHEARSFIVLET